MKNGDKIVINIPERSLNVDLSSAEIESRKKLLKPFKPKIASGYLNRYSRMVKSANTGAILK